MYYNLLIYWRKHSAINEALFFFIIVVVLFGLCQAHHYSSVWQNLNFLWLSLVFASLLSLNSLFEHDKQDGTIDTILLYPSPIIINYIYKQIITHFLFKICPLLLVYIPISLLLKIPIDILLFSLLNFTIASIGLIFLSSISAALRVNKLDASFLRFIVILPLSTPLWLFAFGAIENFIANKTVYTAFAFLIALTLLFAIIGPVFCSFILRHLNE